MLTSAIGFIELGGIVLAWWIFWTFLIRGFSAQHPNSAAIQGLASVSIA